MVLSCVLALAGCGESDQDTCVILANGNKLCGDDAEAYCERFDAPDARSQNACDAVLGTSPVERVPTEDERRGARLRSLIPRLNPIARRYLGDRFDSFLTTGLGRLQLLTRYEPDDFKRSERTDGLCEAIMAETGEGLEIMSRDFEELLFRC